MFGVTVFLPLVTGLSSVMMSESESELDEELELELEEAPIWTFLGVWVVIGASSLSESEDSEDDADEEEELDVSFSTTFFLDFDWVLVAELDSRELGLRILSSLAFATFVTFFFSCGWNSGTEVMLEAELLPDVRVSLELFMATLALLSPLVLTSFFLRGLAVFESESLDSSSDSEPELEELSESEEELLTDLAFIFSTSAGFGDFFLAEELELESESELEEDESLESEDESLESSEEDSELDSEEDSAVSAFSLDAFHSLMIVSKEGA